MSKILYFIHRVREPSVEVNKARAYRWIRWLKMMMPSVAVLAPWLPYVEALDDRLVADRNMGMRDGAVLAGLPGISAGIVCGSEISGGCVADIQNLRDHGIPTISLTRLGFDEPPPMWMPLRARLLALVERSQLLEAGLCHIEFEAATSFAVTTDPHVHRENF